MTLAPGRGGVEQADSVQHRQSVIQRLFQLGLKLQGAAARSVKPDVRATVQEQVIEIDQIIADIRAAVFSLEN